ncbi:MAG TPA: aryl-sulfate sulfotransferase [Vicinamibacteria bacterium]|nr:aryl-sulfate sulfotransferase [Vicinamibacteria bacterium]
MLRTVAPIFLSICALIPFGCASPGTDSPSEKAAATTGAEKTEGPPAWILASQKQPRGLMVHETGASDAYVLFSQLTSGTIYLIDRDARVVHTWETDKVGAGLYFQDDGTLLRSARIPEPPNFRAGGISGFLQRIDWDGEILWEWRMVDEKRALHHDIEPLPNGNILALAWEQKSKEEAAAVGRLPGLIPEQGLWSEWIVEIEPVGADDARIVWEWHVWDHLVQNLDSNAPNYGEPAEHPHRLDINAGNVTFVDEEELEQLKALGYVPDNATADDMQSDFLHINSIDYHPELDQIALSVPQTGEVWILDHSTTTDEARGSSGGRRGRGGDLLYRWGNPSAYGRGDKSEQHLFAQHQAIWIPEGLAGAGNMTVFNNGGERGWSSVVEISPAVDGSGGYPLAEGEAWGPEKPLWVYEAPERESFYAPFISGAVRLENGNTLICSGPQGRYFEVTPNGEIVWEYLNPYHGDVPGWNPPGVESLFYASFRANPIARNHPGLAGRELKPLEPQPEEYVPPPEKPTSEGSR